MGFAFAVTVGGSRKPASCHPLRESPDRLPPAAVARLGVIINIGVVGRVWPPRRRFLSVNYVCPAPTTPHPQHPASAGPRTSTRAARRASVRLLPLARWDASADAHIGPSDATLAELAQMVGVTPDGLHTELDKRTELLERLAQGGGVGPRAFRDALDALATPATGSLTGLASALLRPDGHIAWVSALPFDKYLPQVEIESWLPSAAGRPLRLQ